MLRFEGAEWNSNSPSRQRVQECLHQKTSFDLRRCSLNSAKRRNYPMWTFPNHHIFSSFHILAQGFHAFSQTRGTHQVHHTVTITLSTPGWRWRQLHRASCGCRRDICQTGGVSIADSACNPKLVPSLPTARHLSCAEAGPERGLKPSHHARPEVRPTIGPDSRMKRSPVLAGVPSWIRLWLDIGTLAPSIDGLSSLDLASPRFRSPISWPEHCNGLLRNASVLPASDLTLLQIELSDSLMCPVRHPVIGIPLLSFDLNAVSPGRGGW